VPTVIVTAVLVVVVAVLLTRGADEVSPDDAVERFRGDDTGLDGSDDGSADGGTPRAGVYTFDADGAEELSLLGTSQAWGATVPVTITPGDGDCWTVRYEYNSNHVQDQSFCREDDRLVETGGTVVQSFDFGVAVTETTRFTCGPADTIRWNAAPGDSWDVSCTGESDRGTSVTSSGATTYVGPESITVGDDRVAALAYRSQRELSGDQSGTEESRFWYAESTGLLLRLERNSRVVSPSPLGDVTYTEEGSLHLTDLEPRR